MTTEKYYAVAYGNLTYIGKVIHLWKGTIKVKFLERKPGGVYTWPNTENIDVVTAEEIICGPIKVTGIIPYQIEGVEKLTKEFLSYKKSCK